jgi:U4/U6 small nuclear ribonucleoprotein PRP3
MKREREEDGSRPRIDLDALRRRMQETRAALERIPATAAAPEASRLAMAAVRAEVHAATRGARGGHEDGDDDESPDVRRPVATALVNRRRMEEDERRRRDERRRAEAREMEAELRSARERPSFDPRLGGAAPARRRRAFGLAAHRPGAHRPSTHISDSHHGNTHEAKKKWSRDRPPARSEAVQHPQPPAAPSAGDPTPPPELEWWDAAVFVGPEGDRAGLLAALAAGGDGWPGLARVLEALDSTVEVPASSDGGGGGEGGGGEFGDAELPLMLTDEERKRLRRRRRQELRSEERDRVLLGLQPPPPPKVKLSSLMRILGSQAVQDPTQIEMEVREQVDARRRKHDEANAARMLGPEERRARNLRRRVGALAPGEPLHAAAFLVRALAAPRVLFKLSVGAREGELSGLAVPCDGCNVVYVEGTLKSVEHYKRLVMRRIHWEEAADSADADADADLGAADAESADGEAKAQLPAGPGVPPRPFLFACRGAHLVWEGLAAQQAFSHFRVLPLCDAASGRAALDRRNIAGVWDRCAAFDEHDVIYEAAHLRVTASDLCE